MPGLHVPAWKKLGLQLKRPAGNEEILSSSPAAAAQVSKKRKLASSSDGDDLKQSAKYSKSSTPKSTNLASRELSNTQKLNDESHEAINKSDSGRAKTSSLVSDGSTPRSLKKRKSVQFSADVRVVDGPEEPLDYSATNENESNEVTSESVPVTEQKTKKKKQKKVIEPSRSTDIATSKPSEASPETSSDASKAYLSYLNLYHESRSTWKFNKNLQTQVLQNIFNLYRIPSTYDPAISSYLGGLQGQAARSRLRDSAHKLLDDLDKEDKEAGGEKVTSSEAMEQPAAREAARTDAMHADVDKVISALDEQEQEAHETSSAWQMKLKKRARAEAVLKALSESEDKIPKVQTPAIQISGAQMPKKIVFGNQGSTSEQKAAGQQQQPQQQQQQQQQRQPRKKSRGRKRRTLTGVPDDDDSSSSSSDDSSDSEAENKKASNGGVKRTQNAKTVVPAKDDKEKSDSDSSEDSNSDSSSESE